MRKRADRRKIKVKERKQGRAGASLVRRNKRRMRVEVAAVDGGKNEMRFRFDYRFKDSDLLDEIEEEFRQGFSEMDIDKSGDVSNEEVIKGLAEFFGRMQVGILEVANQVEED